MVGNLKTRVLWRDCYEMEKIWVFLFGDKCRDSRLTAVGGCAAGKEGELPGNSVAYKLLLRKVGISVKCISSS